MLFGENEHPETKCETKTNINTNQPWINMTEHLPNQARNYAQQQHQEQTRKGKQIPYFAHVAQVARTLSNYGFREEVVAAAYLHDTTEDIEELTIEDIKCEFNEEIAGLVDGSSEHDKTASWKERKQRTLEHLENDASMEELAIKIADKIDNVRSINQELAKTGDELWGKFNSGYQNQKWYHTKMLEIAKNRIDNFDGEIQGNIEAMMKELEHEINKCFSK